MQFNCFSCHFLEFFFSLWKTRSPKFFYSLVNCHILMFLGKKNAQFCSLVLCRINLLLEASCFLWVVSLLQLEQCNLASVYLLFCQMELAHCAILVISVGLADISENDWLLLSKSGRVLKQIVVELCSTVGVDKGMCTSLYFSFQTITPVLGYSRLTGSLLPSQCAGLYKLPLRSLWKVNKPHKPQALGWQYTLNSVSRMCLCITLVIKASYK